MLVNKEQLFVEFDSIAWEDKGGGIRRKVMSYGDQLMGVYVEFMRGSIGALHSHPHVQFSYIQKGAFRVSIGGKQQLVMRSRQTFPLMRSCHWRHRFRLPLPS